MAVGKEIFLPDHAPEEYKDRKGYNFRDEYYKPAYRPGRYKREDDYRRPQHYSNEDGYRREKYMERRDYESSDDEYIGTKHLVPIFRSHTLMKPFFCK